MTDLKQKLIDRIKNDDFDVDDDPIENYREAVEYGIGKMMSGKLTENLKKDLDDIEHLIIFDEDREYGDDRIDTIYQKLKDFSENIALKQIDGIVVDRELRKRYHEIIPKIDEYLTKGYDKYRGKNKSMADYICSIYDEYITYTDAINNARNNTPDKEVDLLRDINKSIDAKGGLRDQIVNEAKKVFNETGQTTRKTDRKNIDQNMIANIIANMLDGVDDVDTIREVAKDVLYGLKEKAESHASKSLADNARAIMASNVVSGLFDSDEFRNPIKSIVKYAMKPIYVFEAIPPEEKANKMLKEAADKHQDVIENVMMDSKEKEDHNELSELSKETIESIINKVIKQFNEEHPEDGQEESLEEEHQDDEKQLELSESSESSTIESVNEEEEEREEEDLEEEQGDDKNTSNEMSDTSKPLTLNLDVMSESVKPQITNFVGELERRQTETPQPGTHQLLEVSGNTTNDDLNDGWSSDTNDDNQPGIDIPQYAPLVPQQQGGELAIRDGNGVTSENRERGDIALLAAKLDQIKHAIAELRYSQSQSETNNIFNGMASVLRELPNGVDDEVANRLSQAVGPNGTKLFESKEEAARFLAMLRNLMGGNLSTLRGSGNSEQKHAIRLNIDNKVVSNMPRKPFIVDTHPIPYQY